ncbi:hypothetical protein HELRODRAFT_174973 [Helobdella robusta]|uniref:Uncharacterized protein n=1 Tax=Helobdella robusta TaxID=6412 RepID=T1F8N7_HELRO|nr:hypothetical protein HELRODRAFT_174973 [Helobdella robusta]ESO01414.1 hypothetical protein HELRODRAFT_174973 [Helobdella robusta]
MPVTRGMLRPGGDGSMKSFVIILTVVGLMFLMYYKYKLTSYTSTPEIAAAKESVYGENKMAKEVAKEIASLKEQMNRWKDEYHTCKTDKEVLEIRQKKVVIKKDMENELDNMRKKLYDTNDELKIQKEKVENLSKRLVGLSIISFHFQHLFLILNSKYYKKF